MKAAGGGSKGPCDTAEWHTGRPFPFVGRQQELSELHRQLSMLQEDPVPRLLIIEGEEGCGKTRLLEVFRDQVGEKADIVLVSVKRLQDSQDIGLAQACSRILDIALPFDSGNWLLNLVRGASSKGLVLVLDDIHLLDYPALTSLAGHFSQLPDCMMSLVLSGRGPLFQVQGLFPRDSMQVLAMQGLQDQDVHELCMATLAVPREKLTEILIEESEGQPWLLRHYMEVMLQQGWLRMQGGSGHVVLSRAELREGIRQAQDQLAETRLGNLDQSERKALEQLARLGSHFSRSASAVMLGKDCDDILDHLLDNGYLAPARKIPGRIKGDPEERLPLRLKDSFLRKQLARRSGRPNAALLECMLGPAAMYDAEAFHQLGDVKGGELDLPTCLKLLDTCTELLRSLERHPNIQGTRRIGESAFHLFMDEGEWHWSRNTEICMAGASLLDRYLFLIKMEASESSFLEMATRLQQMTAGKKKAPFPEYHLRGMVHANRHALLHPEKESLHSTVLAHVERHRLGESSSWLIYLGDTALVAMGYEDHDRLDWISMQYQLILKSKDEELVHAARKRIGPSMLNRIETKADWLEKVELLEFLLENIHHNDAYIHSVHLHFLLETAQIEELFKRQSVALSVWKTRRHKRNIRVGHRNYLAALALSGENLDWLSTLQAWGEDKVEPVSWDVLRSALLLHELDWFDRALNLERRSGNVQLEMLGLLRTGLDGKIEILEEARSIPLEMVESWPLRIREFVRLLREPEADLRCLLGETATALLKRELFTLDHLLVRLTLIRLRLEQIGMNQEIHDSLHECWLWLEEHKLGTVIQAWLKQYRLHMDKVYYTEWHKRADWARVGLAEQERVLLKRGDSRIQIQMLGEMRIMLPEKEQWTRLRAPRLRSLLALLVAGQTLKNPLTRGEFAGIFLHEEGVDSSNRDRLRNLLGIAVHRLRSILGQEAVITGGPIPLLNRDSLDVDLLQLTEGLENAELQYRSDRPLAARENLLRFYQIIESGLPFPGEYSSFFESLRDDIESRSRRLTLDVCARLEREEEELAAQELLQLAFTRREDDEEFAQALRKNLLAVNRRTEAERVWMRHTKALGEP